MLNIGITDAAKTVVDDFDDNGLDAICYETRSKTLYLVQAKMEANKQFDEPDAIRFCNGAENLLRQYYNKFNINVKKRIDELNNAFDEAEKIQLVVAYVGSGISEHAKNVLKSFTEDEEHHEAARLQTYIAEYGPEKVKNDLLAEQSIGEVNDSLRLSKWQHIGGDRDAHIGIVSVSDLVALHKKYQKALYERNIRYFLGSRDSHVNKSIQETLRRAPNDFFYLNNGITALANSIDTPKGSKAFKLLRLRGLSIINGAQTISSAAEFVEKNPDCDITNARVLVTIIKADSEGKFGRFVTRARNHQNPVSTGNFASLDPRQENLRRELAYLGYSYHYRPEAMPRNTDNQFIITIEQAMKALALFEFDSRYPYWLKNEISRFQNTESDEYQSLFTQKLTGSQLVNKVMFFRFVRDVLLANQTATRGAEGLFYKHGVFVIAAILAKRCRTRFNGLLVLQQAEINELLSAPLDGCRQTCWDRAKSLVGQGRSVLAFFQNQSNTVYLLDSCMAEIYGLAESNEYKAVKQVTNGSEAFPLEKVFRYLITQAPQI